MFTYSNTQYEQEGIRDRYFPSGKRPFELLPSHFPHFLTLSTAAGESQAHRATVHSVQACVVGPGDASTVI